PGAGASGRSSTTRPATTTGASAPTSTSPPLTPPAPPSCASPPSSGSDPDGVVLGPNDANCCPSFAVTESSTGLARFHLECQRERLSGRQRGSVLVAMPGNPVV